MPEGLIQEETKMDESKELKKILDKDVEDGVKLGLKLIPAALLIGVLVPFISSIIEFLITT